MKKLGYFAYGILFLLMFVFVGQNLFIIQRNNISNNHSPINSQDNNTTSSIISESTQVSDSQGRVLGEDIDYTTANLEFIPMKNDTTEVLFTSDGDPNPSDWDDKSCDYNEKRNGEPGPQDDECNRGWVYRMHPTENFREFYDNRHIRFKITPRPGAIPADKRIVGVRMLMQDDNTFYGYNYRMTFDSGKVINNDLSKVARACGGRWVNDEYPPFYGTGIDVCTGHATPHYLNDAASTYVQRWGFVSHYLLLNECSSDENMTEFYVHFHKQHGEEGDELAVKWFDWIVADESNGQSVCEPPTNNTPPQCVGFNIYDDNNNWENGGPIAGSTSTTAATRALTDRVTIRTASSDPDGMNNNTVCWSADGMPTNMYNYSTSWACSVICGSGAGGSNTNCDSGADNTNYRGYVTDTLQNYINAIPDPDVRNQALFSGLMFTTRINETTTTSGGFCMASPAYNNNGGYFPAQPHPGNGNPYSNVDTTSTCHVGNDSDKCMRKITIGVAPPAETPPKNTGFNLYKTATGANDRTNSTTRTLQINSNERVRIHSAATDINGPLVGKRMDICWAIANSTVPNYYTNENNWECIPMTAWDGGNVSDPNDGRVEYPSNAGQGYTFQEYKNQLAGQLGVSPTLLNDVSELVFITKFWDNSIPNMYCSSNIGYQNGTGFLFDGRTDPNIKPNGGCSINSANVIATARLRLSNIDCNTNPTDLSCNACLNPNSAPINQNSTSCDAPVNPAIVVSGDTGIGDGARSLNATLPLKLDWTDSVPANNPTCGMVYDLEIKKGTGAWTLFQNNLTTSEYTIRPEDRINGQSVLEFGTDYQWRVTAQNINVNNPNNEILISSNDTQGNNCIKAIAHTNTDIRNINWEDASFNDNSWQCARSVWSSQWAICRDNGTLWNPFTSSSLPASCTPAIAGRSFNQTDQSILKMINTTGGSDNSAPNKREFFRKTFVVPDNSRVSSATLYISADNLANVWVNGTALKDSPTLNNDGNCTPLNDDNGFNWSPQWIDVSDLIRGGQNVLAINNFNGGPCNTDNPMAIQFYLRIQYGDGTVDESTGLTSNTYSFSTNYKPDYLQSGAAFAEANENPRINMNAPFGQSPILRPANSNGALCNSNLTCDIGPVSGADVYGDGAAKCYTGNADMANIQDFGQTDNPITFWFDYEDRDNTDACGISEFKKHKLALVRKNVPGVSYTSNIVPEIEAEMISRSTLMLEYDFTRPAASRLAYRKGTSAIADVTVRTQPSADSSKMRIAYTIKFKPGFTPSEYDIFALMTSNIDDPRNNLTSNGELYDQPSIPIVPNLGSYRKVGEWTVDVIAPEVQTPTISDFSYDTFRTNWNVKSDLDILDLSLGCYSTNAGFNRNQAAVIGYYSPGRVRETDGPPFPGSFTNPGDFINIAASSLPKCTTQNGLQSYVSRVNSSDGNNFVNFSSVIQIQPVSNINNFAAKTRVIDRACNFRISEQGQTSLPNSENWLSTGGSSVMTENVNIQPQTSLESEDHHLYCDYQGTSNSNNQMLYSTVKEDVILNLSTSTVLSSNSNLNNNIEKSLIKAVASDYDDMLDRNLLSSNETYYQRIEEKLNNQGLIAGVIPGPITVNSISELNDMVDCDTSTSCYIKVDGHLTINGNTGLGSDKSCDARSMILVHGNLTINHNLQKSAQEMCCAFVVKDNITFQKPNNAGANAPKDEFRFNNAPAAEQDNWINSSLYDCTTGFYYTDGGQVTINTDTTAYPLGGNPNYADALALHGSIITGNRASSRIINNRTTGLRNNLQPPLYITQDSCIYKNFKAASEVFLSTRDINYYSSD